MLRTGAGGRVVFFGLVALLVAAPRAVAGPITTFNANVNEWSSSTPPGPGIYPIGGSGEVNGGFVVSTGTNGDQIGLRAERRFVGVLPQTNDGALTATYFAPAGTSGGNLALWDFDVDIDLRGGHHTISDYTATITVTDRGGQVTPVDLTAPGLIDSDAILYQNALNPGFTFLAPVFPSFDPNAQGVYSFDLKLVPKSFDGDTLEAKMNVDVAAVPEPSALALCLGGAASLLFGRRLRARYDKL